MAQTMKIDVAQAMKMGEKLPAPASGMEQVSVSFVHANELTYADPSAWNFHDDIAEFLGGNPQVDGTYDAKKLVLGSEYKVYYYVSMKDRKETNPVNLTLQLPHGKTKQRTETITLDPSRYQAVFVGHQHISFWRH
ncbi:uncharacterized protein LOC108227764 [Daucus carota subsp. sativus]|uniref:uncharacterized protein LOC108227764 n=1 Tax=Daucus carota subsp. sativus TaxID=79200 RepID=UPI0007EF381A|nr:PREDICTED: uncharacterized protein LOC108227764 [Daucus carota subsp. sativus]